MKHLSRSVPVMVGALLAALLGGVAILGDLRFDDGRLVAAVIGAAGRGDALSSGVTLAETCRGPLLERLAEQGFEPSEVEFGPAPRLAAFRGQGGSFGDSFTFRDGAAQVRVDGVVACVVSGGHVTVDVRVESNPHRDA